MSLRRVAIGATNIFSSRDYRNAGVSRAGARIIPAMARARPETRFHAYIRRDFELPNDWRALPNLTYERIVKHRVMFLTAPWIERTRGSQAWYTATFATVPRAPMPRISMLQDVFPLTNPEWFGENASIHAKAIRDMTAQSDWLTSGSEFSRREAIRVEGYDPERIVTVWNGPGNVLPPPSSVRPEAIPFRRYFFTLSTLEPRKNIARLVEAVGRLSERSGCEDVGIVMAGGEGWKKEETLSAIAATGHEDRLHRMGYADERTLADLMAHAEATVCCSLAEGFGLPVLEAMIAGSPVLCSRGSSLDEVGGDAALTFSATDVSEMERALLKALNWTPQERASRIARGRARAEEFTWEKVAERTMAQIERAVREKK